MRRASALLTFFLLTLGGLAPHPAAAQGDAPPQEVTVDLVIATGVQDREPVGAGESFPADVGQLFAWLRVEGAAGQAVQVVWSYGENRSTVPLEIGGSPWRTWSSKQIPSDWTGSWTVEVQDQDGNVLESTSFTVGD